jgi:predicted kinase
MEMILFIGLQASGKSHFYKERFYRTHVRINLDMLKTRHREGLLLAACIAGKTRLVIDNTNLTRKDRAVYIESARTGGFDIHGYFFQSRVADCLARNASRDAEQRVPDVAILGASKRLELPSPAEGFERLHFVRLNEHNQFIVEDWKDEV